jgi:hypothetical protein
MSIRRFFDHLGCRSIALSATIAIIIPGIGAAAQQPPAASATGATPVPVVIPHADHIYYVLESKRPQDAGDIHVALGVFSDYEYSTFPAEQSLGLKDPKTGAITRFVLSSSTRLDGKPLPCSVSKTIGVELT